MASSIYLGGGLVTVEGAGALDGDGTSGNPLGVVVDGVTVTINGSNQLVSAAGGTPGGADTQVQFNDSGSFGGSTDFTWTPGSGLSVLQSSAFGAAVDPTVRAYVHEDRTTLASAQAGLYQDVFIVASGTQAGSYQGVTGYVSLAGAADYSNFSAGLSGELVYSGSGTVGDLYGIYGQTTHSGSGAVTGLFANWSFLGVTGGGDVTNAYGYYLLTLFSNSSAITNFFGMWIEDLASSLVTNAYYFWADSRGVYRIREDAVADGAGNPQAIPALYNPRFTKYTAGAANYERSVEQWVGNVLQLGAQAGGTGTLRAVQILGASLTVPGGTTLLATSGTLSNGAAAEIATMTNGPAAGNPTKWIPIDDNGTTRYIPAW